MLKGIFATALVLVLVVFMPSAYAGKSTTTNFPVISTVHTLDPSGAEYALHGDDGVANSGDVYTNFSTRSDSVVSQILGTQDWKLDTINSTTRQVWASFDAPVNGDISPLLDGYRTGTFQTLCSNWGDTKALGGMTAGENKTCGMILNLGDSASTAKYRIAFQEKNLQPVDANGNVIGTDGSDRVSITCNSVGTDMKCNNWTIDPLFPGGSIGTLVKITTVKGRVTLTPIGHYYYTFHIDIAK